MASIPIGFLFAELGSTDSTESVSSVASAPTSPPPMEAPPEGTYYDTPELGIAAVNAFAQEHSYALTTRRSKRTKKGVLKTIRLSYDRGREYDIRWQEKQDNPIRKT
ncbi:uncharacterized protein N7498_004490 [Penicillium cinerascens]|uniref:Uncharacterized protein n=1 Tax=Penicillium cinerascens TaxID=70096 RepID=A0A9W9MLL7_9EURO|nr:uncharacterized protein N7498_004490 [Penicillium cinerascens]KAJ5203611.1 hypothetical protein N7498_004490 [Penicillium cinerascens]